MERVCSYSVLFRAALSLRALSLTYREMFPIMLRINSERMNPPLEPLDMPNLEAVCRDVYARDDYDFVGIWERLTTPPEITDAELDALGPKVEVRCEK